MKNIWLQLSAIILMGVQLLIVSPVSAVGPDPSKPYIQINPFLSSTTMKNGKTLAIKANVDSNFPITRGYAQIEGFNFTIPLTLEHGTDKKGFWLGTWQGRNLTDKNYGVNVTFFDSTGHSWTDRSLYFTDPIAGNDEVVNDTLQISLHNTIVAQKITFDESIEYVNSVKVYIREAGGLFRLALYNENSEIVWQSPVIQNNYSQEWVEVPIQDGTPYELKNLDGSTYYIAMQGILNDNMFAVQNDENSETFTQRYLFNAFPQKVMLEDTASYKLSAYVIYNEQYRFVKQLFNSLLSWFE